MKSELEKIISTIVKIADKKKAEDIKVFHVSETVWITDYIIILGVKNDIHSKALVIDFEKEMKKLSEKHEESLYSQVKKSGKSESGWVIMDANSIIIHFVDAQTRSHYDIDEIFEKKGNVYHY